MSFPADGAELLQEIADGDLQLIDALVAGTRALPDGAALEPDTALLVQLTALVAVDASAASWFVHLGGRGALVEIDKILGALIAVAPIVGTPRVVSAAAKIIGATDLGELLEDETI